MVLNISPDTTNKIPKPGSISFEDRITKTVPFEWGYGSTPRVGKLRDTMFWKSTSTKEWINMAAGVGKCAFREGNNVRIDLTDQDL